MTANPKDPRSAPTPVTADKDELETSVLLKDPVIEMKMEHS
jgi:hypothetical protein